jgi:hypothetical protein
MTQLRMKYLPWASILVISLIFFFYVPENVWIQGAASIPVVATLIATIARIVKDQVDHDRAIFLQDAQNHFALGVRSHMASVAFDKHVLFCEAYAQEAQRTLQTLLQEGPTDKVKPHIERLFEIQKEYDVWLTEKIQSDLEVFESALRELAAAATFEKAVSGTERAGLLIDKMYEKYAQIMGPENMGSNKWKDTKLTNELTTAKVISILRVILGTEGLVAMRKTIASKAVQSLEIAQHSSGTGSML